MNLQLKVWIWLKPLWWLFGIFQFCGYLRTFADICVLFAGFCVRFGYRNFWKYCVKVWKSQDGGEIVEIHKSTTPVQSKRFQRTNYSLGRASFCQLLVQSLKNTFPSWGYFNFFVSPQVPVALNELSIMPQVSQWEAFKDLNISHSGVYLFLLPQSWSGCPTFHGILQSYSKAQRINP